VKTWPNGNTYSGDFVNGECQGFGLFTHYSGDVYEGCFESNQRQGEGKLTTADGFKYQGSFTNNKKNGLGQLTFPNGSVYEGEFKFEKKHGLGKYSDSETGLTYDGIWVDDRPVLESDQFVIAFPSPDAVVTAGQSISGLTIRVSREMPLTAAEKEVLTKYEEDVKAVKAARAAAEEEEKNAKKKGKPINYDEKFPMPSKPSVERKIVLMEEESGRKVSMKLRAISIPTPPAADGAPSSESVSSEVKYTDYPLFLDQADDAVVSALEGSSLHGLVSFSSFKVGTDLKGGNYQLVFTDVSPVRAPLPPLVYDIVIKGSSTTQ
jgi:hypothetical protein